MYYSKRNKPDTERQILYDPPYMWDLKVSYSQKQAVEWWLPGGRGVENGASLVKGYGLSFKQGESSKHLFHNNVNRLNTTAQCTYNC